MTSHSIVVAFTMNENRIPSLRAVNPLGEEVSRTILENRPGQITFHGANYDLRTVQEDPSTAVLFYELR